METFVSLGQKVGHATKHIGCIVMMEKKMETTKGYMPLYAL